ncbi:hypothetical protein P4562_18775 [Lysinibacillus xylanilyticus]|uniref:hypothetical protein n=1 Tax=Lysinibacillus xylanilyticus TaxID=582475 RepID=UPI002E22A30E|nr:hypothetical protein [Lysinibacillus xylanilyticus]
MKHSIYTSEKGRLGILNHYEQYLNSYDFEVERAFVDTSIGKTQFKKLIKLSFVF